MTASVEYIEAAREVFGNPECLQPNGVSPDAEDSEPDVSPHFWWQAAIALVVLALMVKAAFR